ncbi:CopG family transcriptional regulator [Candidatus Pacearchaeota archaeon]|nr:CopG family transcriptional regulator [Candidatus Pacearchaeota archaeon]
MKIKKKTNKIEYGTISLPMPLIDKIKERMKGTGMTSVSAYVAFVLRQLFSGSDYKNNTNHVQVFSKEEEQSIRDRLRNLGYL